MYEQATDNAPSARTVTPFFVLSAVSWLVAVLFIAFHPDTVLSTIYFNSTLLTVTHILVLGFVSSVMFGALFQMLPVIFIKKIYSEKLAQWTFYLLLTGTLGLVASFYFGIQGAGLTISGVVLNTAVVLFVINVWKTIGRSAENITAKLYIRTSAVFLAVTALIGLLLALNFFWPYLPFSHIELLKVHAHFGVFGWFLFLIIGVSSVLVPMFLLVHKLRILPLNWGYVLLLGGLIIGVFAKIWSSDGLLMVAYLSMAGGIGLYLYFIYTVWKVRPRKNLDFELKKTMASFPALALVLICGLLFVFGLKTSINLSRFYIIVMLIGFISTLILGKFYKTLPFIIWLKVYKPHVGKMKTLLPKQLYNHTILKYQYYTHIIGFVLFFAGIVFRFLPLFYVGIALLIVGATLFTVNVFKVVSHQSKTETRKQATEPVSEDAVYEHLKEVIDPELFVNIIDLGLVFDFDLKKDPLSLEIEMTLTSKGCPLSDAIKQDINETLHAYYPDMQITVNIVWEPAWNMDMVSEEGKKQLMGR